MLWHLDKMLEESIDWRHQYGFAEKENGARRPHTCRNPKRHISLVSLLLWHKIVALRCFVWCLGLQMWSGSEAVRQNFDLQFFLEIQYPAI